MSLMCSSLTRALPRRRTPHRVRAQVQLKHNKRKSEAIKKLLAQEGPGALDALSMFSGEGAGGCSDGAV